MVNCKAKEMNIVERDNVSVLKSPMVCLAFHVT